MVRNAVSFFGSEVLRCVVSLHRPVQLLSCVAIVFSCILLSGCSSAPLLANIYIVSFTSIAPPTVTGTPLAPSTTEFSPVEVRVGYFTLCARADKGDWICGDRLDNPFPGKTEPWDLYKKAENYRTQVISPICPAISVALNLASVILVSFFPIAGEIDLLPLRGRKVRVISTALLITSLFTIPLTFSAALWQHTTAATASPLVRYLSSGALSCTVGSTATTLAWLSFGASFVSGTMSIRAMFMFFRHPPDSEDANPTLARENRVDAWLSER